MPKSSVNLRERITSLILKENLSPDTKTFNQHFLADDLIFEKLIKYLDLKARDTVLEIGAGFGILTKELAKRAKSVIAVEIDERFKDHLDDLKKDYRNITLIFDNFLEVNPFYVRKIVGSLPFMISEPFLMALVRFKFRRGVFIFGEKFAKLMTAKSDSEDFGFVSLFTQSFFRIISLEPVPPEAFYPIPRVSSALVVIESINEEIISEKNFILRELCMHIDRKIKNTLVEACIKERKNKGEFLSKKESTQKVKNLSLTDRVMDSKLPQLRNDEIKELVFKIDSLTKT